MAKRRIVVTAEDHRRLQAMLRSEFAAVVGQRDHLFTLEAELERASVAPPEEVPADVVTMNSTMTLRDLQTGELETYTLVYPDRADILNKRLSVLAPVGTAVLGQRVGDVLRWRIPDGWRRLKIEQVIYQPERAGAFDV